MNHSYAKRTLALLTAALMLTSALTSCGGETPATTTNETTDAASADTAPVTEELDTLEQRQLVDDGLEDRDFGGATFTILGVEYFEDYYHIEEENGDIMDDTVFRRNSAVMERFNIQFVVEPMEYGSQVSHMKTAVLAGDDAYQLYAGHVVASGAVTTDAMFLNWYDVPHVDFSRPWWSKSTVEDLTYDGKTFLAVGDFALGALSNTYCVFFNKQIANDYDLPDLYEIVNDGKWTVDRMTEISREVYRDINGDGVSDMNDLHGLTLFVGSPANALLWAFGEKIAKPQPDGTITLDYFNTRMVDIYQKMYDLLWVGNTTYAQTIDEPDFGTAVRKKFNEGNALFTIDGLMVATADLRDSDTEYGIIPMPKWDEAQEAYYTMVDGSHDVLGIPMTVRDPDMVGTVVEALNAESYKRTVPVYYDIVLKTKGSRDEESVAIIDMICQNRIFDFAYVYGGWSSPCFWPQTLMNKKSADISSYYEKSHKSFDKYMDKIFTFFSEFEAQ